MNEIKILCLKLRELGYKSIIVIYEGAGDSGGIENIEVSKDEAESIGADTYWGQYECIKSLPGIPENSFEKVEDFAYSKINTIEDWWNNEGGYGTMVIDIFTYEYTINNKIRVVTHDEYTHNGELEE